MLRSGLLLLVIVSSAFALEYTVDAAASLIRDKRQRQVSLGFDIVGDLCETALNIDGQQTVLLNGEGSDFAVIATAANQTLQYVNGRITFSEDPFEFDANELSIITVTPGGSLDQFAIFDSNQLVEFELPDFGTGRLYTDREGRAFYTNSNFIESSRPGFQPLKEPPPSDSEVLFEIGADTLVLNIDNTDIPDGVADPEDDRITLTGSVGTEISGRQTLEYVSNTGTIIVRDGNSVSDFFGGISELNVLDNFVSGGNVIQRLRTFSQTTPPTEVFNGPGYLYTNGGDAFYTTIPSVQNEIGQAIFDSQFNFVTSTSPVPSAIIESTLGPRGELIELVGAPTTTYPTASTISYGSGGIVTVNDRTGGLLAEFGTTNRPVDLDTFINHEVLQFSGTDTGSLSVPQGGLSVTYNQETNSAFAFPTRNRRISNAIQDALASVNAPAQATTFTFETDGLGGAILIGQQDGKDPVEVVTVSNSQQFDVGRGDIIRYSGNVVTVENRRGETIASFPNISSFSVNGPSNTLERYSGEATQTVGGPARLYFDAQSRGFCTSNDNLINNVDTFLSTLPPGPRPVIARRDLNGNQVVNVETPTDGRRLVEVSSSRTTTVPAGDSVFFSNNQVGVANSFNIPLNARASYDITNERVTVTDVGGREVFSQEGVTQFSSYTSTGGGVEGVNQNTTFGFNGKLYLGPDGGLFTFNNDINQPIVDTLNSIGAVTSTIPSPEFSFYDGRSTQIVLGGSAPSSFPGDGIIFSSGSQSFYSTDDDFNDQLFEDVPKLAPISADYNSTTDNFTISSFAGDLLYDFSINTVFTDELGTRDRFRYDDDSIVGLTFEPIPGVDELRYYNGLELQIIDGQDNRTFSGPGFFAFNPESGVAFFTDDPTSTDIITQRCDNIRDTFQVPEISEAALDTTSKFREVTARVGRAVTVYDGASVNLDCVTSRSNPAADFQFFVSTDRGGNFTEIDPADMMDNFEITSIPDGARIQINRVDMMPNPLIIRCTASNIIGSDTVDTPIEARQAEPPEIVNNYFPFTPVNDRFDPSGLILTAQTTFPERDVIVPGEIGDTSLIPNPALTNDLVHIGCKAEGRPKANIVWELNGMVINASLPEFDIFEPRQGRSVLTVNYSRLLNEPGVVGAPDNFTCRATNAAAEVVAGVVVTPTTYECVRGGPSTEPCSATCGFGVRPENVVCERNSVEIDFEEIPDSLFELPLELCLVEEDNMIVFCPVESFAFNDDEDDFSECSVTCGCGVQRRNISCFVTIDGVLTNETVDERFCTNLNLKRPEETRVCNLDECPIWVINGTFGPCSTTCGLGTRQRQVDCFQNVTDFTSETNFTFDIVDDSLCDERTMPANESDCNRFNVCPYRWEVSRWEDCNNDCQERNVTCVEFHDRSIIRILNDSDCEEQGLVRPHSVRSCGGGVCSRGDWRAGDFSECNVQCGFGTATREVNCTMRGTPQLVVLEDGFCDARFRPSNSGRCFLRNCPGRCDSEPEDCRKIQWLGLCKMDALRETTQQCCKSCPAQATPIPLIDLNPPAPPPTTEAPMMMTTMMPMTSPAVP